MRRTPALLLSLAAGCLAAGCFADPGLDRTTEATGASSSGTTAEPTTGEPPPPLPVCGDGVAEGAEECDEGEANGADGSSCRDDCRLHVCGDSVLADDLEECDLGGYNGKGGACTEDCALNVCGDGYLGPGEGCDDGNAVEGDGCTATCKLPGCGDGMPVMGEACDDGNLDDTDACTTLCQVARCGDGFVQAGVEGCDDGNVDPGDACTDACEPAICGDGVLQLGVEACDDGDLGSGDGCSGKCQLEQLKVFVTSVRFPGTLGGVVGADEKCQTAAAAAKLQGKYLAWISDGELTPQGRFAGELRYVRVDGSLVAESFEALVNGEQLENPLNMTEFGDVLANQGDCSSFGDKVWTNVGPDGTAQAASACEGWSSEKGFVIGVGDSKAQGPGWTATECLAACAKQLRLYCFEQET